MSAAAPPDPSPSPCDRLGGCAVDRAEDRLLDLHPILEDVPLLAGVLAQLTVADRLLTDLIDDLVHLDDHDLAATLTGVGLDLWLTQAGLTRHHRRQLLDATRACRRLPSLHTALRTDRISYSQTTRIATALARLPTCTDAALDADLAELLAAHEPGVDDPDSLWLRTRRLRQRHHPDPDPLPAGPSRDLLHLQPRIDGTGGTGHLDLGPTAFAALEAATDPGPPPTTHRTSLGHPGPHHAEHRRHLAERRAHQLIDLCNADLDATTRARGDDDPTQDREVTARRRRVARRPRVLVRLELGRLADAGPDAAHLLTHLAGGALRVDADTARRITDTIGADVRLVLTDHGRPLGVGRRTRRPPGWLTDALLALHDTCTEPACPTPARVCDADHAHPWTAGGHTDLTNLAPVCATANHLKETDGWTATRGTDASPPA